MNVAKITLTLDTGKTVDVTIDAGALVLTSPTMPGDHRITLDAPPAPTKDELVKNLGEFEGTEWDPIPHFSNPPAFFAGVKAPPTWAESWALPPTDEGRALYSSYGHQMLSGMLGGYVQIQNIGPMQRKMLGMP